MKTAIIVLNTNDSETTLKFLNSINDYSAFNHIVVVDNRSTDQKIDELKKYCIVNHIDFLTTEKNKGYNAGNNVGAKYAIENYQAEILFISNSDIVCPEESIQKIIKCFKHKKIAVATGLINVYDRKRKEKIFSSYAWAIPKYIDMCLNCLPLSTKFRKDFLHISNHYSLKKLQNKQLLSVEVVSGCFFAIRTDIYQQIHGFDERIFLYCEENILGYMIKKLGYKECVVVDAPIIHDEKTDKLSTLKKIITRHKRTLKSSDIYIRKYLNRGIFSIFVFNLFYIIGAVEGFVIHKIREHIKN